MNELTINSWIEKFLLAWIPLFVAVDPIGLVPFFLGLTQGMNTNERRTIARNATWTAAGVAIVFVFLGKSIFKILGISVADFQIAGGLILFLLASGDIVSRERLETADSRGDIGIVPLGLPMIAGPAMLTTLIIMVDSVGILATLVALLLNMALVVLALKYSDYLARWIGLRGLRALHKIIALLLAAIAVNMIRRGWQSI